MGSSLPIVFQRGPQSQSIYTQKRVLNHSSPPQNETFPIDDSVPADANNLNSQQRLLPNEYHLQPRPVHSPQDRIKSQRMPGMVPAIQEVYSLLLFCLHPDLLFKTWGQGPT